MDDSQLPLRDDPSNTFTPENTDITPPSSSGPIPAAPMKLEPKDLPERKKIGVKKLLIGFGVFVLLLGTISTIFLVQKSQDIRNKAAGQLPVPTAPRVLRNTQWRVSDPPSSGETHGDLEYASSDTGWIAVRNNGSKDILIKGWQNCPPRHDPTGICWPQSSDPKFEFTIKPKETVRVEATQVCGQLDFDQPYGYGRWFGTNQCRGGSTTNTPTNRPTTTPSPRPSNTPTTGVGTRTPTPRPSGTSTPRPTATITPTLPPGISAACGDVEAYDTNWNVLSSSQLAQLKSGDSVRFAVSGTTTSGSFDKARVIVNGTTLPETSAKKPGTDAFYSEYTIPSGLVNFTVTAQVHHITLGWF